MFAPPSIDRAPALAAARGSTVALTVFRLAGLFTFLTVAMGAVVSATKSGAACPTWPGCQYGDIAPPWEVSPIIEFAHRVVAISTGPLILAAALTAGRLARPDRWVHTLPWVGMVGALASAAFGRHVVLEGIPAYLGAIDLFCALVAMTAMGGAAVLAARPAPGVPGPEIVRARPVRNAPRPAHRAERHGTRITGTAGLGVCVLVVMHVTGILTAGPRSYTSSMGWPLWRIIASDLHPWLQVVRLVLAGGAAVLVVATAVSALRTRLRAWGLAITAVLTAEILLGVVIVADGLRGSIASAHSVLAVALLCGLGVLTTISLVGRRP